MLPSILITGATGRQGGATAHLLLKQGVTVHALVRDPTSLPAQSLKEAGAIIFKGDFDDIPAIKSATAGVSGLFLNPYPTKDPSLQVKRAQNFIDAALESGTVETVVLSTAFYTGNRSIWGEDRDPADRIYVYYSAKAAIEEAVQTAGFKHYAILRPGWLYHNYLLPDSAHHFPYLPTEGILTHAYEPETRMANLDAFDVGQFAAAALVDPEKFSGHEIELGNENLTPAEAVRILSKVSGSEVQERRYRSEELEELKSKISTLAFQLLANERDLSVDGKALEEKYGIKLTSFESFLEREKELLLKSLPLKE